MSKRPAPRAILCPGCSANFDTEIHIPFVGSCGDSICAVCLNEKKIKNCPECNLVGGFAWNQNNSLAMKFLSATAEKEATDLKKAKLDVGEETNASGEPVPTILDPNYRHFLAQIVNQLDPRAFVRLARTCKSLHDYCFNSNDVKITYDIYSLGFRYCYGHDLNYHLAETKREEKQDEWYYSGDYAGYKYGFLSSADARRRLKNYPFAFKLEVLRIETGAGILIETKAGVEFFESLFIFLAQFPVKRIEKVCASWIEDGKGFMKLLRNFHVKQVELERTDLPEDIWDEFHEYVVQNLNNFESQFYFPERLLLNLSMPTLRLYSREISKNTFTQLVMKWANSTDDLDWTLKLCSFDFDVDGIFDEVLPYYHKGPISAKRPLAFHKKNKLRKFYILREDGKVVCCSNFVRYVCIYMVVPKDYPPCLLPESDEPRPEVDSDEYSEDESDGDSYDEPESGRDSDDEPEADNGPGDESSD